MDSPPSSQSPPASTPQRSKRQRTDAKDLVFRGGINRPEPEKDKKRIACDVHHSVYLEEVLQKCLDSLEFQRLKSLKQLGSSQHIYPAAVHTRFIHSLGVMHLAEKLGNRIAKLPMPPGVTPPSARDVLCLKLAGLLHDLGHGPFSHVFDGKVVPAAAERAREEGKVGLAEELESYSHEQMSLRMMKRMLDREGINLNDYDSTGWEAKYGMYGGCPAEGFEMMNHRDDIRFIEELILGSDLPKVAPNGIKHRIGRGPDKWYLYDIVSNADSGLDVDKLDYMVRDAKNSIGDSGLCLDPLLSNAAVRLGHFKVGSGMGSAEGETSIFEIVTVNGETFEKRPCVAFPQKAALPVFEVFKERHNLHAKLYQHKGVVGYDALVTDFLLAADKLFSLLPYDGLHGLRLGEAPFSDDAFVKLNDSSVIVLYEQQVERAEAEIKRAKRAARDESENEDGDDDDDVSGVTITLDGKSIEEAQVVDVRRLLDRVNQNLQYKPLAERLLTDANEIACAKAGHGKLLSAAHMRGLAERWYGSRAPNDLTVQMVHIHYGKKGSDPLDGVRFFRKGQDETAVADAPASLGDSHLPRSFESRKLVVYWRGSLSDTEGLKRAQEGAAKWADAEQAEVAALILKQQAAAAAAAASSSTPPHASELATNTGTATLPRGGNDKGAATLLGGFGEPFMHNESQEL